ncbi:SDR family NAD(P)-dependent oxidoreductase [Sandaracinobacteroides hominis]|uniref:SDR family NAD(P)-dependent oxidoreductase n=1 Tax=Sandaracinobacteroides hominis TaxID=2780086 RepID=UPI0018F3774D|nr:SDR family oxidoreductase [Sandaracinobacteroides hominis]
MASQSVSGLKAVVTGAGSGMGAATARLLAEGGATVAVTDVNLASAEAVASAIGARAFHLDVGDPASVTNTLAEIAEWAGGLDILVNNAGISGFLPIDHDDYEALWERIVRINATGEMRVIRAALPHLRRSASPRIVNIASTEALGATALDSAYCAAKAAVTGLTRGLAVELGKEGITVNCICPGPIDTGMTADVPEADKQLYAKRRTALRRYGRPEEVAHMTVALCQPGASFITGATIPVDGGLMARNA